MNQTDKISNIEMWFARRIARIGTVVFFTFFFLAIVPSSTNAALTLRLYSGYDGNVAMQEAVKELQRFINRKAGQSNGRYHGYNQATGRHNWVTVTRVDVDGYFGPITEGEVKDLQIAYSLYPDGIVGPLTTEAFGLSATQTNDNPYAAADQGTLTGGSPIAPLPDDSNSSVDSVQFDAAFDGFVAALHAEMDAISDEELVDDPPFIDPVADDALLDECLITFYTLQVSDPFLAGRPDPSSGAACYISLYIANKEAELNERMTLAFIHNLTVLIEGFLANPIWDFLGVTDAVACYEDHEVSACIFTAAGVIPIPVGKVAKLSRFLRNVDEAAEYSDDTARAIDNLIDSGMPADYSHNYGGSLSAARRVPHVLQTGGNTLRKRTAQQLNEQLGLDLTSRDWGRALEALKRDLGLSNKHHGRILDNGDYIDDNGEIIGSLLDYLP